MCVVVQLREEAGDPACTVPNGAAAYAPLRSVLADSKDAYARLETDRIVQAFVHVENEAGRARCGGGVKQRACGRWAGVQLAELAARLRAQSGGHAAHAIPAVDSVHAELVQCTAAPWTVPAASVPEAEQRVVATLRAVRRLDIDSPADLGSIGPIHAHVTRLELPNRSRPTGERSRFAARPSATSIPTCS